MRVLLLMLAGALGTLARYALSVAIDGRSGPSGFPVGTLAVNVAGCFGIGLVWVLAEEHGLLTEEQRLVVLIGFLGAFTTFSTFAFESGQMALAGEWGRFAAQLLLHNGLGIAAFFAGLALGRAG